MSKRIDVLCVSRARVSGIEFTFEGDTAANTKGRRASFSVSPQNEAEITEAAFEAYRKGHPIEVYEDRHGKIVKIQPTHTL
jgi:hypothetical protein